MPYRKKVRSEKQQEGDDRQQSHLPHRHSPLVQWATVMLLVVTPLAVGTVHWWAVAIMFALSVAGFGALVLRPRARARSFLLFPMGAAFLAACAVTVLQLVPMPIALVKLFSPSAAGIYEKVLEGTKLSSGWRTVSQAPVSTALELVKWLSYAMLFVVAANYFNERRRARLLLKTMATVGFVVVCVGLLSSLMSVDRVFGVYRVKHDSFLLGPFVNPNHLAGYLTICTLVSVGLALTSRQRQIKALFFFLAGVNGGGVFLTLSRGGMVALVAGLVFLVAITALQRSRRIERLTLMQGIATLSVLIAGYLAYDTILRELRTLGDVEALREYAKFRSWAGALPLIGDHPLFGTGRGAWASVYTRYKTVDLQVTFTHAECQPLQLLAEWGVPFGLVFIAAAVATFFMGMKRSRKSLSMASMLAALFAVSAQNLVDFNLETGGVAAAFTVLLALVSTAPFSHAGRPAGWELKFRLGGRVAMSFVPLFVAAAAAATVYTARYDLGKQTERLLKAAAGGPAEPCAEGALGEAACTMLEKHPADFMAPLVLGKAWLEGKPRRLDRAAHWLSRSLLLFPANATAHRLLGRALFLAGFKRQAIVEYRLACRWDPGLLTAVTTEVMRLTGDPELAIEATPPSGKNYLTVARNLKVLGQRKAAEKAVRLALEQDSDLLPALDFLANLALEDGRLDEVAGIARREIQLDPLHDRGYLLQGLVLLRKGDTEGAEKAWREGLQQVPDSALLSSHLMQRYLSDGRLAEAEAVVKRLQSFAPSDDASQARLNAMLGRIHETKGMLYEARNDYRMAWQLAPGARFYLLDVARMEHRMGNWDEAERIYRQLLVEGFQPERMKKLLEEVKKARERGTEDAMRKVWLEQSKGEEGRP